MPQCSAVIVLWRQFHSSTMSGQLFAKQSDASLHWSLGQIDASCSGAPLFPGGRALGKEWLIWLLSRSKMSPVKWNRFRAGCLQNFSAVYTVMKIFCNNNRWREKIKFTTFIEDGSSVRNNKICNRSNFLTQ